METIEIILRIVVSKEGKLTVVNGNKITHPKEMPKAEEGRPISFMCDRFGIGVGHKKANSCHGCTLPCIVKGQYRPKV